MIVSSQKDDKLHWREHAQVASQFLQRMTYKTGVRDMGGYLISISWVGSIISDPSGN